MPVILDNAWSSEGKWLDVKRILFTSQEGDRTTATVLYTSSNPLVFDTTVDPGAGIMVWNNIDETLISQVAVSKTDRDGGDQTLAWGDLKIGDQMTIRQDTGRYFIVDVAAAPLDMGSWFQIDVSFVFAVGDIQNNKGLDCELVYFPDSIPSGGDRLEIRVVMEWPWVVYRIFDPTSIVPKERGIIPISDISIIVIE